MEDVLEVYRRPYDPKKPVVCMDETSKQLLAETRTPLPPEKGQEGRFDYEYQRNGVANVFMFFEPLCGRREVMIKERRTKTDWAHSVKILLEEQYPAAEKVILVMDNLNTHNPSSLYETFPPEQARRLTERLEIHYTPEHGSWLNMAEIELSVLFGQCLSRRIPDRETLAAEVRTWTEARNASEASVDWQFQTDEARIKLKRLYPNIED